MIETLSLEKILILQLSVIASLEIALKLQFRLLFSRFLKISTHLYKIVTNENISDLRKEKKIKKSLIPFTVSSASILAGLILSILPFGLSLWFFTPSADEFFRLSVDVYFIALTLFTTTIYSVFKLFVQ